MSQVFAIAAMIDRLARPQRLPPLAVQATGISQPAVAPEDFVAPELTLDSSSGSGPAVILVSAPAAVGKSWLSRHISAESGNPYWDLSEFRVGSNFFSGTIVRSYGGHGFAELEPALRSGAVTLVVDAADEALVRAGSSNFEAALSDLAEIVGSEPRKCPSAIIFGRPETIELAGVVLEEAAVPWEMLDVAYFPEASARAFVHRKVRSRQGKASSSDVDAFLDMFFAHALDALGNSNWDDSRGFLGYSPVLDALAEFAALPENPHAALQALVDGRGDIAFWKLVGDIVDGICDRERRRFARTFSAGVEARKQAALECFTRDEQLRLLLEPSLEAAVLDIPNGVPHEFHDELVEAARSQLSEHPFVRPADGRSTQNPLNRFSSPVFREFVVAWALLAEGERFARQIGIWAGDPKFNPTPMALRFASVLSSVDAEPSIHYLAVPVIAQAAGADVGGRLGLRIIFDDSDGPGEAAGEVTILEEDVRLATLRIRPSQGQTLRLYRAVARLDIDAPNATIEIGGDLRDLSMGPDVTINAGAVRVVAEDVRVHGGEDEPIVYIRADEFSALQARLRVYPGAGLRIDAPDLFFPWQRYAGSANSSESTAALVDAGLALRKVLRRFNRSSIAGRLTYPREAMETALRKGRVSVDMFDFCIERGKIVARDAVFAFMEPPSAAAIERVDIQDEELRDLLGSFLSRPVSE